MIYFQQSPTKLELGYKISVLTLSHLHRTRAQTMEDKASYVPKYGPPSDPQEAWACENVRQPNVNRKKYETRQDMPRGTTVTYGAEFGDIIWEDT